MKSAPRLECLALLLLMVSCTNNPYRPSEYDRNIYYTTFSEGPKNLDPAVSYTADQYAFILQVYEPPLQYHYLIRPYELMPLTAESLPVPRHYDKQGNRLEGDPPVEIVDRVVYTVNIKKGIYYQNHPCFAKDAEGNFLFHDLTREQMRGIDSLEDFPKTGTRELTAADYVYQIKRFALPTLQCPILPLMSTYIPGLAALSQELQGELNRIRAQRRVQQGALYNQERDEREHPIRLDLDAFPVEGLSVIDRYTYEVELRRKYPQFLYWLAMPFFAPVPREASLFYEQAPLVNLNIKLDNRPVGTGPYSLSDYFPNREIVLTRNPNFHGENYPTQGEPGDRERGLLDDAGMPLPFIEKAVFKRESEAIPRWNKFLQGYYDTSGILNEVFDQAVQMTTEGELGLTEQMSARGVRILKAVMPSTYYFAFNMLDDIVGGYGSKKQKLRQAISIAVDIEEWVQIFDNGHGIPAQNILPPEIFGYRSIKEGMNPYVYAWDDKKEKAVRRPIEYAARLLAEAGYPEGVGPDGKPLTLCFDTYWTGAWAKPRFDWLRKQLSRLNIDLQIRQTDYNRFQDKARKGNFQILFWGWNADYPDPENFFFLLYGPNGKVRYGGENVANYSNRTFNRLFKQMECMANTPERMRLIGEMVRITNADAPMIWGYHPVEFGLYHEWYKNANPMAIGSNTLKYQRLEPGRRAELRMQWNRPIVWPVWAFLGVLPLAALPAALAFWVRQRRAAP